MASTLWSYIKYTADPLFSKYIRLKAAQEMDGWCKCVTCPNVKHWKDMDCGHFVNRDSMLTRWDERNVGPQCTECNCYQEGNKAAFAVHLRGLYGDGIIEELDEKGRQLWLGSDAQKLEELKELCRKLRAEIKKLEKGE